MEFTPFDKIPRLSRNCIITEKIDGTNASIYVPEDGGPLLFGSRKRWITPEDDNFGFARWASEHEEELRELGPGHHFGEWWGSGIQRGYGLDKGEKRFSLFNTSRWEFERPACCLVVPVISQRTFTTEAVEEALIRLREEGSLASPGFMRPEGVIIFHTASRTFFKKTLEKDEVPKGQPS